jgi:transcriptional regulator with XRE-family HTH domain
VELAEKVGITQVLISAYETDRAYFSVEMAVRFAMTLGISLDELLHPQAKKAAGKKPNRKVLRR